MSYSFPFLVIASGMLYSLLMIKMNGIYVSQLLSSAYSATFVTGKSNKFNFNIFLSRQNIPIETLDTKDWFSEELSIQQTRKSVLIFQDDIN